MEVSHVTRDAYPPSFCRWRLLLAIMAVTQLSVLLMALGRDSQVGWQWLTVTSSYAQCLALICAGVACATSAWMQRIPAREAWVSNWLIVLITAFGFSYLCGIIGTVLGVGPGSSELPGFMLKSVMAVGLVHAALLRYLFVRSQWQLEQVAQAEARVQALQARIRPHFLFNSLNTIASLVPEDAAAAEMATVDLADLFRGSMRRADSLIPVAEELSLARKYLDMEQRRLGSRLQVDWNVSGLPEKTPVLPLVLQPLLENAVIHGIQPSETGGVISIFGRSQGDEIAITICNTLPGSGAVTGNPDDHGMALANIRRRLELAHGDQASLLTSQDGNKYYAVLTLPGGHGEN